MSAKILALIPTGTKPQPKSESFPFEKSSLLILAQILEGKP